MMIGMHEEKMDLLEWNIVWVSLHLLQLLILAFGYCLYCLIHLDIRHRWSSYSYSSKLGNNTLHSWPFFPFLDARLVLRLLFIIKMVILLIMLICAINLHSSQLAP